MSSSHLSSQFSQGNGSSIPTPSPLALASYSSFSSRLEGHRRFRKLTLSVATALSASGLIVTASHNEIRLYRVPETDTSPHKIKKHGKIRLKSEWGEIRAIDLSSDILAIITYTHLILYMCNGSLDGTVEPSLIETKSINSSNTWTPQSVAVRQFSDIKAGPEPKVAARAWIAVGGQGKHCVRVYKYSMIRGHWSAQSDRITLSCSQSASSIRIIGFSPERPKAWAETIFFGAAESNRVFCWILGSENECQGMPQEPSWVFDCNARKDGFLRLNAIKSAQIFLSPSKKAYLFCAINQTPGSQVVGSCTVPLDDSRTVLDTFQKLAPSAIGPNVLCGKVTPSGRFLVAIEKDMMRVMVLQAAERGGIGCNSWKTLERRSSLSPTTRERSDISISVRETRESISIAAVDSRGRVETLSVQLQAVASSDMHRFSPKADSVTPIRYELDNEETARFELPGNDVLQRQELMAKSRTVVELPDQNDSYAGSIRDGTTDRVFLSDIGASSSY